MVFAEETRQVVYVAFYEPRDDRPLARPFRLRLAPVSMPVEGFSVCHVKGMPGRPNEKQIPCDVLSKGCTCMGVDVDA